MNSQTELDAWKIFLAGRIAQEQGNEEDALASFERALQIEPDNPHFLNSKSIALTNLKRDGEALATHIAKGYAVLANTYIGENDKPEPWVKGLQNLLREAEKPQLTTDNVIASVVW